jgi:hypothetical protein
MFQVAPVVMVFFLTIIAAVGAILAMGTGMVVSAILGLGLRGIGADAVLGAVGSVLTVIGCAIIPWPRNTVSESLGAGLTVQTTLNRFQHPYIAASVISVLLSLIHLLYRLKQARIGHAKARN